MFHAPYLEWSDAFRARREIQRFVDPIPATDFASGSRRTTTHFLPLSECNEIPNLDTALGFA